MTIQPCPIPGLHLLQLRLLPDARGSFTKVFHQPTLLSAGLQFELQESYFSVSQQGVLRGMHFQVPPHQHSKIVYCAQGRILDVVLDLRRHSPTYGQHFSIELNAAEPQALYIPEGLAHGFLSLEAQTITCYLQSSVYAPSHDAGIRYDSFGMKWPVSNPLLSERDAQFLRFDVFESPF